MYDTILVAIDDSETAAAALAHAIDLARSVEATVSVLSVVDSGANPLRFGVDEVDDLNRTVTETVAGVVDAYDGNGPAFDVEIRRGRPDTVILEYAAEIGAETIVLGRHGDQTLPEAILGSTADRVTRLASVPVTVVPPALADEHGDN
ncbi:universal stress protein [Natronobiforma cellulositropha]|uniref:universal stress protein n=1 Tax=Natronobiforma cellulositropha TaxID=1679076 RepID=UPI0021D600B0|nr:universal stress protein [Natronobiforma cellulositropha]